VRGDSVRRPRVDRQRSASRTAVDQAATKPGQGNGTTSTWAAGPARNSRKVVTWLRLCAMSPSAKRQCKGLRANEGAGPAPDRGAAAAPECHLRRRAFSAGAVRQLGLTSNQVWGLAKTDEAWSASLDAALTATRREDLRHGTTPAYVRGCVCKDCREHQRVRMTRNR
jgi:hypothetical protein